MAKKKLTKKVSLKRKLAKKALPRKPKAKAAKVAAKKPANSRPGKRMSWLDDATQTPLIDDYARQLESFIQTMADGKVDDHEIDSQEKRLVKLMKKVEPQLDDQQHAQVTELLCELTAYDLMQTLYSISQSKPATTTFRG